MITFEEKKKLFLKISQEAQILIAGAPAALQATLFDRAFRIIEKEEVEKVLEPERKEQNERLKKNSDIMNLVNKITEGPEDVRGVPSPWCTYVTDL